MIPAGTVLSVTSGETGAPVAGARVVIGARELATNAEGRLSLPESVEPGSFLDLVAPGFLDRQTLLRDARGTSFTLWPSTSPTGLDAAYTFELVYASGADGRPRRLLRIAPGVTEAHVVPDASLRGDAAAMDAITGAARAMTEASGGAIAFIVSDEPEAGAVVFDLVVDPGDPAIVNAVAVAKRKLNRWTITGGTVVFATGGTARTSTTLHELGHMFGLGHSPSPQEVMYAGRSVRRTAAFSHREALAMKLMLQRPAGNDRPDNDRGISGSPLAADAIWTSVIVCPR